MSSICSKRHSGDITSSQSLQIDRVAATIAHGLGHYFGVDHDDSSDSGCNNRTYIMSRYVTGVTPEGWSTSSINQFKSILHPKRTECLHIPEKLMNV